MADGSIHIDVSLQTKQFVQELNGMQSVAKTGLSKLEDAVSSSVSKLKALEDKQKSLTQEANAARMELLRQTSVLRDAGGDVSELSKQYEKQQQVVAKLETELAETTAATKAQEQRVKELSGAWAAFHTRMADVTAQLRDTEKNLKEIGSSVTSLGKTLSVGVTAPIIAMGAAIIKTGSDFEKEMKNLQAITGASADEMGRMEEGIRGIALESNRSVLEVAANAKMLAESGGDMDLFLAQLSHGTDLATATQTNLATTLDFVGSTMKTFKVEAEDTQSVVDSFATVTTLANLELSQLGESYSNVGGSAESAGMSIDNVNAFLTEFANAGQKGGSAGTILNGVIKNLSTPTDKAAEALDELNISLYDNEGASRGMFDIMGDLESAMAGLTDEQRNHYESVIFDTVSLKGWSIITAAGIEEISALSDELAESTEAFDGLGQAAGMAATQNESLQGKAAALKGSLAELAIQGFQILRPMIERVIAAVQSAVDWFTGLDQGTKEFIVTCALIAASIGPALVAVGTLITLLGSAAGVVAGVTEAIAIMGTGAVASSAGIGVLSKALATLTSPTTLAVAAVVAITLALAKFTPLGDKAYTILVALVAGFVAFKAVAFVQGVIAGVSAAMAGLTVATTASTAATHGATAGMLLFSAAQKAAAVATAAYNLVVGLMTGTISLVTIAQWAWNAAMLANPIGLIIAGVAALAAGIAFLIIKLNEQSAETKALVAETNKLIEKQQTLTDAAKESGNAYTDSFTKMETSAQVTRDLASEIEALAAIENKSAEDTAVLQAKIDMLNDAVPGLSLAFDENTDSLNMTSDAMRGLVDSSEAQVKLNAQLGEQQRLKEEEIELTNSLVEAEQARLELEQRIAEDEKMKSADKKALNEQIEKLTESENAYRDALSANADQQEALNPLIAENAQTVKNAKVANEEMTKVIKEQETAAKELADAHKKAAEEIGKSYEKYAGMATDALKKIEVAEQKHKDGSKKSNQEIRDEIKKTIESNTELVDVWSKNLSILEDRGLDPKFVSDLRAAGPEMNSVIAALVQGSEDEIKELNRVFSEGSSVAIDAMKRELGLPSTTNSGAEMIDEVAKKILANPSMEDAVAAQVTKAKTKMDAQQKASDFPAVGKDMSKGVAKGIDEGTGEVNAAAGRMISGALNTMRATADEHSPSKETYKIAAFMADGLVNATNDKSGEVAQSAADLTNTYIDSIKDGFDAGLSEAAVIMLGEWTDVHQGMTEVVKSTGAERVQAEIDTLDKTIASIEKKNAEIAKAEDLANKQRAVAQAKTNDDRIKAQKELDKTLAANELAALKERRDNLQAQLSEIVAAYNDMSGAIVSALKEKYSRERELAVAALDTEVERRQTATSKIIDVYEKEHDKRLDFLSRQKDASESALSKQVEAQKAASDAIIEQYEREYEAKLKTLDYNENAEIGALQAQIDAIDKQTELEDKHLKAQEDSKKLFELAQKIEQAETDEARIAAIERYNEEVAKQERAALLEQRKEEKASLKTQIAQVKEAYKQQRDAAKEEIESKRADHKQMEEDLKAYQARELESIKAAYESQKKLAEADIAAKREDNKKREEDTKTFLAAERKKIDEHYSALTKKERLEAEARRLMLDGDQREIINLLNSYTPDWATAGQSAGEAFLRALQGVTPSIESEVGRIMGLINQASQTQARLASTTAPPVIPPTQQTQQSYTVKSGDTLSGIAAKYGVTVTALRSANSLKPEDDGKLQVGKTLKIPVLHTGGISLAEQVILADKNEAVAPLSDLFALMERAVTITANKLATGFSAAARTINTTTNNDTKIELVVNYEGDMSRGDVYGMSRVLADQTAREMRGRGLAIVGA